MNDFEWIESVLKHRAVERVPYNFMFSPPVRVALKNYFKTKAIEDFLEFPIRMNAPKSIKPLYAKPEIFGPTIVDEFGVTWSTSDIDRGAPIGICLKQDSLKGYRFPDPCLSQRFKHLESWCLSQRGHYRIIWIGDLWERATFMCGMENLLLAISLNEAFVQELLESLTNYILETMRILLNSFEFEAVAISDDYGTQRGLIISPQQWRKFVKPCLRLIYERAKSAGKVVFHHSCGNIIEIIADMINIGLDILNPIQPEAMNSFELKKRFGENLTFCGGMPTQTILPSGTREQVRSVVRRLKTDMSQNGGYIFEPGITLLCDVPFDNILSMIDEAKQ